MRVERHRGDVELREDKVQELGCCAALCEDDGWGDVRRVIVLGCFGARALPPPTLLLRRLRLRPWRGQNRINVRGRVQE